ncbi:deoxyguanosinetriphosphate triphosphohydrolase [Austwickia chelonae]|uniref:deoxyguanosinetriphosphate triphosphohydrolase n=1 Tax=Austwickia chelonae TaxID=100225 RepID=UPI0013C2D87B|nr:deoxyguanosinetriphosphate triphosphohydrolase [Austwickia chelonae]
MTLHDAYDTADRERWVAEDPAQKRSDRDDFARDRARLVHSAALRRLGAKTQVMRPDADDFIRNRLTHSLEVAQIGREFGAVLGCSADVVDTACLAHDLGHPPFGHYGEQVLDELSADIGGFEGNAQTLRLLTRLEAKRFHADGTSAGLNLTRASLDAATKYPWPRGQHPTGGRKYGVYQEDEDAFTWLRRDAPVDGKYTPRRCLEAQVMDWSDDVAYSVHDVEDGVAAGLIDLRVLTSAEEMTPVYQAARSWYAADLDEEELAAATARIRDSGAAPTQAYDGSRRALSALKDMTSRFIGHFVAEVEQATLDVHGPGPHVRYAADLVIPREVRAECTVLKALAVHFMMLTPERHRTMDEQRTIIEELHAAYTSAPEERLDPVFLADFHAAPDDTRRRRVVIDQIASLTDMRAVALATGWRPARA